MESIEKELIDILWEVVPGKKDIEIAGDTDILSEFELDSLLLFELVDVVEERMGVNLFEIDDFVSKFRNFGDLCQAIQNKKI
ncbi:MAG: acyl carrier protein [Lachnospiraceae bacterium]|nr:acyl carrier protein [Lachnospiraceae bacterium]